MSHNLSSTGNDSSNMKLILASLVALLLAVPVAASAHLRTPAQNHVATAIQGELTIDIERTTGDDVSVVCNMILLEAFDASYKQVYGVDGMIAAIEAETVVPDGGVARRKLGSSTASYLVYWVGTVLMECLDHLSLPFAP
jgi:hypothetical protein